MVGENSVSLLFARSDEFCIVKALAETLGISTDANNRTAVVCPTALAGEHRLSGYQYWERNGANRCVGAAGEQQAHQHQDDTKTHVSGLASGNAADQLTIAANHETDPPIKTAWFP